MTEPADIATTGDIAACFRLLLGRQPSPEEWAGHSALAGQPLASVVKSYLDSPEFAARTRAGLPGASSLSLSTPNGVGVYTSADDLDVGRHAAAGHYEPAVAAVFRRHLRQGMTVLDVGANIGVFTMLAASLVGPAGRVLAVEPNEANVRLIEASRRANGFSQVSIAFCAAGRGPGLLSLRTAFSNGVTVPLEGELDALLRSRLVPSFPLTAIVPPGWRIDFIKIDIEGDEHTALAGAADMLRRDRPVIVSEFSPRLLRSNSGVEPQAYADFLTGLGYRMEVVHEDGSMEPCPDAASAMAFHRASGGDHIDILLTPEGGPPR